MRLPEQRLWDRARSNLSRHKIKMWRVENVMVSGMPDVMAICFGITTWLEMKEAQVAPVRATTPLLGEEKGLNRDQRNWHIEHFREGGRSLVVVGVGLTDLFIIPGAMADEVNTMSAGDFRAASIASNWAELAARLGAETT